MSATRTTELIGMDTDGRMYLWSTGEVRPVSAFEVDGYFIKDGHYVIQWRDHAITVHCGNTLVDGELLPESLTCECRSGWEGVS
jgi:hypothetical protein